MHFFLASQGRSGTTWLCWALNQSTSHEVHHEVIDQAKPIVTDQGYWEPFPVVRWKQHDVLFNRQPSGQKVLKPHRGEVHGHLARYLSPFHRGPETTIHRRGVLVRDRRAVVRSWMRNPPRKQRAEFWWVALSALKWRRRLLDWAAADPFAVVVHLEAVTRPAGLEQLARWAQIRGLDYEALCHQPRNVTGQGTGWEWDDWTEAAWQRLAKQRPHLFADEADEQRLLPI